MRLDFVASFSCAILILVLRDYGTNELLDRYDANGLDDDEDVEELSAAARRLVEKKMDRRDRAARGGKGARAAQRSRAPAFLDDDDDMDDDDDELLRMKRRTRRQYDERRDMDDMDGLEDVSCLFFLFFGFGLSLYDTQEIPLEQLSDIKAKSIVEWIANPRVKRSIVKHFRQFLMTYVDEQGASVYGQRIRNLGESALSPRLPPN